MVESALLDTSDVAEILGLTPHTIRQWARRPVPPLPFIELTPRNLRVRPADLQAFLTQRTRPAAAVQGMGVRHG